MIMIMQVLMSYNCSLPMLENPFISTFGNIVCPIMEIRACITSRNKYADMCVTSLIFLSHLTASPLLTVHIQWIPCWRPSQLSFTSCLALYTLPPVQPFFCDLLDG